MARSDTRPRFAALLGGIILVRALYALGVWLFAIAVLAGWLTTDPVMTGFFRNGPLVMLLPWLVYCLGYGLAGLLVWRARPGAALACYAGAFIIDTTIWIAFTSIHLPDVATTLWASIADVVTNLVDLVLIAVLALILVRRVQARAN